MVPIFKMIPILRQPVALQLRKWRLMRGHLVQKVYGKRIGGVIPYRGSNLDICFFPYIAVMLSI